MLLTAETAVTAPIADAIPWYFGVGLVVAAALLVVLIIMTGVFVVGLIREIRQEPGAEEPASGRTTLVAMCLGAIGALVVGLNIVPVWHHLHPENPRPEVTASEVRAAFAQQGASSLALRDTDPRHSLERIDPEGWEEGVFLDRLLMCDAGQFPEAGQFPAYEGFDWSLPVRFDEGEGMLSRVVAGGSCTFTLE